MNEKQQNRPLVVSVIEPIGQQAERIGNRVVVNAALLLRGQVDEDNNVRLDDKLYYGSNCNLMGRSLSMNWGYATTPTVFGFDGDYRCYNIDFEADTWKEAYDMAREYLNKEVSKLKEAMKARTKALKAAGKKPKPEINVAIK